MAVRFQLVIDCTDPGLLARLSDLGATMVGVFSEEGIDHYAVAMKDPEGNEFDIN